MTVAGEPLELTDKGRRRTAYRKRPISVLSAVVASQDRLIPRRGQSHNPDSEAERGHPTRPRVPQLCRRVALLAAGLRTVLR